MTILLVFVFLTYFGNDSDPLYSLISLSANLFICLNIGCYLFFENLRWNIGISSIYILKIFIGVIHYLYFIDASYFSSGNFEYLTFEYAGVWDHLQLATDHKKVNGIFAYFHKPGGITHQEMWSFIAIPFVYYGDYVLNISPLNSFFASLTTLNLLYLSKHYYLLSKIKLKYVFVLGSLFPITFISSLFWRDLVGVYFLSLCFILLLLSKKSVILNLLSILISCGLLYLFRTVYPVVILTTFILSKSKSNILTIAIALFLSLTMAYYVFSNYLLAYISPHVTASFLQDIRRISDYNILIILVKVPLGFIGPFPWNQFLISPVFSYQLQEYLQAIFNLTVLYLLLRNWKTVFLENKNDIIFQTSVVLIVIGLLNPVMNSVYVSFPFIYVIPILAHYVTAKSFLFYLLLIGILLLTFNIFYLLSFRDGLNISGNWR